MNEDSDINTYINTVARLEADIAPIDPAYFYASTAISLRRIADSLDALRALLEDRLAGIAMSIQMNARR